MVKVIEADGVFCETLADGRIVIGMTLASGEVVYVRRLDARSAVWFGHDLANAALKVLLPDGPK